MMTQSDSHKGFLSLSEDAIAAIGTFLPLKSLGKLRQSSKHMCRICDSNVLWRQLCTAGGLRPLPPLRWKKFAQRLSYQRWPASRAGLNWSSQGLTDAELKEKLDPLVHLQPAGTWLPVLQSGPRYNVSQEAVTFAEHLASSSALADHKANSTAVLGVIPIGLDREGVARLQRKLFGVLGMHFDGDMAALTQPLIGQTATAEDAQWPAVRMLDAMPHSGERRIAMLALCPGDAMEHPNATARLVELFFSTCSSVLFAAPDDTALSAWITAVSPHMTTITPAPFSTADNTPYVVFATERPLPALRDLLRPDHAKGLLSWVLNRSSCIGEITVDANTPIALKTLYAAPWVAPECSVPVPITAVLKMMHAAAAADGLLKNIWGHDVKLAVCAGQSRHCRNFYVSAMQTEIADANNAAIAFADLPVPLDPSEMVALQDHFFYASLRAYAMAVRTVSGSDTAGGMAMLEEFKKDISTSFRMMWAENISASRRYCTTLFDNIFHPLHEKYNNETSNGFHDKKSLHQWYTAVTDKISEYLIKSKGPRKYDVLAERITTRTIGGLKSFCIRHPSHPYVRIEDVDLAAVDLTAYCQQQLTQYHVDQDTILSAKQRTSAIYTACVGSVWAVESVQATIQFLNGIRGEAETWADLLQMKREALGLLPTALLSLTAYATHTPMQSESETNSVSDSSDAEGVPRERDSGVDSACDGLSTGSVIGDSQSLASQNPRASTSGAATVPPHVTPGAPDPPLKKKGIFARLLARKRKPKLSTSVMFSELDIECQGVLQALMAKSKELRVRVDEVAKNLNLKGEQVSNFGVIQREFSTGFKALKAARMTEGTADEIANRLRDMRDSVRSSIGRLRN